MSDEAVTDTGTPAAEGETGAPAETPAADAPWYGSDVTSEDDIGWIQNKGYKNVADLLKATRGLEKHFGVPEDQIIKLPGADNPDGMGEVYDKLGRPKEASGYVFDAPEGTQTDDALVESFRGFAHEKGLTSGQATDLFNWQIEQAASAQTAQAEADKAQFDSSVIELKNACGTKYDEVVDLANRAGDALGLDDDKFGAICKVMGPKFVTEMFAKIGGMMSEDKLAEGSGRTGYGQTIEQTVNTKTELLEAIGADPVRLAAYQEGKGPDYLKMQTLYKQLRLQEGLTEQTP